MKKSLYFVLLFCLVLTGSAQDSKVNDVEKRIKDLLDKMTLEEKVGQMNQLTVEVVSKPRIDGFHKLEIDTAKLREMVINNNVGSILNTGGFANTLENWHEIINTIQDVALNETRLKIPILYGIDAIHGANYTRGATVFPQSFCVAASFDRELVRKSAQITALEVRASGITWDFNPVLNLAREPAWSRFWETFGEDVYLASEMGKVYVEALQDNLAVDGVAACAKHYLGYCFPKSGLDRSPAYIPERQLREIFLPPFEAAIKAGALTVMVNSSEINGIPSHSDHFILTELLKEELGFRGLVVSDWEDVKRLYTRDKIASSPKDAVKIAVMAGLDMSMVPFDVSFYEYLLELVKEGEVPMSRIDDAVSRILRVKFEVGLFENAYPLEKHIKQFASESSKQVNLQAALESITLLKNDNNILPLEKNQKIFLTGPTADKMSVLNGSWSLTWQGREEELLPTEKNTIKEALQNKIGEENVVYYETPIDTEYNYDEIIDNVQGIETVVLCLGEEPYCEGEGNIYDITLPDNQLELAKALVNAGKKVVLVLVEGRPRLITKIAEKVDGIVMAYLPGMEGGDAITEILFGDANPCGKLPFTYPKYPNGNVPYDYKWMEAFEDGKYKPLYPFGYGMSYTTFEYSNLTLKESYQQGEEIIITVDVTNTGSRTGKESVLLYLSDLFASVSRPVNQLKAFDKVELQPGEIKTVTLKLDGNSLSFIGRDNKRIVEKGSFKVTVGSLEKIFDLL